MDPVEFCNEILYGVILYKTFERIDQKKQIESKRRTWNKKRKIEKVQEIQEKRSKWKYQAPEGVSIKSKLDAIFSEYDESRGVKSVQSIDSHYKVPITLAIN